MIRCWFSDGIHDVKKLEQFLRQAFGENMRMFDYRPNLQTGYKVAVTATTIRNASPIVFSNYNGAGPGPRGILSFSFLGDNRLIVSEYRLIRPRDVSHEPFVWQA